MTEEKLKLIEKEVKEQEILIQGYHQVRHINIKRDAKTLLIDMHYFIFFFFVSHTTQNSHNEAGNETWQV